MYRNIVDNKRPDSSQYLPGGQARHTLQQTVDKLLLPKGIKRHVTTDSNGFRNYDRFTHRAMSIQICERSRKAPLTLEIVQESIRSANRTRVKPYINIPIKSKPTKKIMKELVGGAYHETFHTLYDFRGDIDHDLAPEILEFVGGFVKWEPYLYLILFWHNEFLDVKIEKLGRVDYPQCQPFLREVHRERLRTLQKDYQDKKLDILNASAFIFRHYAFQYKDAVSSSFLKIIKKRHKHMVELFEPGGEFHHYVESARNLDTCSPLRSLALTFELLNDLRQTIPEMSDDGQIDYLNQEKSLWGLCRLNPSNILDLMLNAMGDSPLILMLPQNPNRDEELRNQQRIIHVGQKQNAAQHVSNSVKLVRESRRQIGYYRSRLRTKIKALEIVRDTSGVEDGVDISEECFESIRLDLGQNILPTHFEWEKGEAIDTSTAAYLLCDLSGSMAHHVREVSKVALSVIDPLESLGCKTMCSGFEDSWPGRVVNHHIFKHWDESYLQTRWRFSLMKHGGCTPMAEGMQFALNALESRQEGNRLLFVITDGCPNGSQDEIKELVKVGAAAGMITIGIGFGEGAKYVQTLFPEGCHVWAPSVEELPPLVVKKLLQKMSPKLRGKRMKKQVLQNIRTVA